MTAAAVRYGLRSQSGRVWVPNPDDVGHDPEGVEAMLRDFGAGAGWQLVWLDPAGVWVDVHEIVP